MARRSPVLATGLVYTQRAHAQTTEVFSISVSPNKTTYAIGDVITITGRAYTTAGQNTFSTTDASVTASLVRTTGTGTIPLGTVPVDSSSGNYTLSSAPLSTASGIQEVSYRITVNAVSPSKGQASTTAAIQVTSGTTATGSSTSSTTKAAGTVTLPNPISCNDATCLISQIVRYILGIIAVIATLMFVWGGVMMLTSGGNADQVKRAKETLTWAAIGVIVIMLSWVIIKAVLQALTKTGS